MTELRKLVAEELSLPVDARVSTVARAIAAKHGKASRAVLFYGSCLREKQLDGLMLDFYLIVSNYRAAYEKRWLAAANRLLPPNVFYFEHEGLAAKYAVLSEDDFARTESARRRVACQSWARFAQPSRLVWSADEAARERAIDAVSRAAPMLLAAAGKRQGEKPLDLWRRAFSLTYSAPSCALSEWGASVGRRFRPGSASSALRRPRLRQSSVSARRAGAGGVLKEGSLTLSLRLAKASATFAGGADYIAWKINRHAGTEIRSEAVAAAASAACRDQPFAETDQVRGGSLAVRARAAETAVASAPTVNGLRSSSWPRSSSLSPSPT